MFFPVTFLTVAVCLMWARRDGPRSPLMLALAVWGVGLVGLGLPIFSYRVEYSLGADALIAGSLLAATVGYFLVRRPRNARALIRHESSNREHSVVIVLLILGAIGSALLVIDARRSGISFALDQLFDNANALRTQRFRDLAASASLTPFAFVGTYLSACSVAGLIAVAKLGRDCSAGVITLAVVNFVLISIVSVFVYAGRASLVVPACLIALSLYLSGKRMFRMNARSVLIAAGVVAVGFFLTVSFFAAREGAESGDDGTLANTQRAEYRPWIAPTAQTNPAVGAVLVNLGYFLSPMPTFSFYMAQDPIPGPLWGEYSFPLPARTLSKLAGTSQPTRFADVREEVFLPLGAAGYFGNVWATWVRDLVVDFGVLGALLFSTAWGALLAWARNRREQFGGVHYLLIEVLGCFVLAFGAFTGMLTTTLIANAYLAAVAVMLAARVHVRARPDAADVDTPTVAGSDAADVDTPTVAVYGVRT